MGSRTLTFIPLSPPSELARRSFKISADSGAASTLLILQAILPFCLFAANESNEPILLDISGGTNVSFSLSLEYLDQVLLPTLEDRWGIVIERTLKRRAWSLGSSGRGEITIKVQPLPRGQALLFQPPVEQTAAQSCEVKTVDVSVITPASSHLALSDRLAQDLAEMYPDADINFKIMEDSGNVARWYILLVGRSARGTRWGRDVLTSMPKKTKSEETFITKLSRQVCRSLFEETSLGGRVDEHLQDQIICFQALAQGRSSLPRRLQPLDTGSGPQEDAVVDELTIDQGRMKVERVREPFGHGTLHAQTARWIAAEMLPNVKFFLKGDVVEGVGFAV